MRVVSLSVPREDAELAADRLWGAGAGAVEERPAGQCIELRTVLSQDDRISGERLGALPSNWQLSFIDADEPPSEAWREFAVPNVVNDRLVLRPAWLPPDARSGVLEVAIEPAGSFGLGDHPTTRLSAGATDRLVHAGDRVLDVGCGSGVLGIIAAHRGAAEVTAIDIADAAVEATRDNAERNGMGEVVHADTTPVEQIEGSYDLVLANVLAPALVAMAADLRRLTALNGHLIVSGVLADRHVHVLQALAPMHVVSTDTLDGWAAVVLAH